MGGGVGSVPTGLQRTWLAALSESGEYDFSPNSGHKG